MQTTILWLRQDLRLADNPALWTAAQAAERLIPIYIHAPQEASRPLGGASRWWLHHSLARLDQDLQQRGSRLIIRQGDSLVVLRELLAAYPRADVQVLWNRLYEPAFIQRDTRIKAALREQGIDCQTFNALLMVEPWQVANQQQQPYRVFTPYWKAHQKITDATPFEVLPIPPSLPPIVENLDSLPLDALQLLPKIAWDSDFYTAWQVGESAAQEALQDFCDDGIKNYAEQRNRPDLAGVSRLSPYLCWGQISPRQIVQKARGKENAAAFVREIGWREFNYHLLYHFPDSVTQAFNPRFTNFPWREDYSEDLAKWQRGQTGYPIIDAGMAELWQSGWMHNRVRMIVASFLTKNLLIPWQAGEAWFWDTLLDADTANNVAGWQWTAGCGADAAPYFRIFNPVSQGEKFDPQGDYVRRWLPTLARLPSQYIHQPWAASSEVLQAAAVHLGQNYPTPQVDLKTSRAAALHAYELMRSSQ